MKKLLKYDLAVMVHKKEFAVAFCVMMAFAVFSLFQTEKFLIVWDNSVELDFNNPAPEWMTVFTPFLPAWQVFTYLFAFLVVLPYSMSYLTELESGMIPVLLTRVSKRKYCLSKALTCFIGNAVIIGVPLLFNYFLCRLAFPTDLPNSIGSGGYGVPVFNALLNAKMADGFLTCKYPIVPMLSLFLNHRQIYLLVHIGMITLASGLAGVFLLFLSLLIGRYRALLFLPVFLLVRLSAMLDTYFMNAATQDFSKQYVSLSFMEYFHTIDVRITSLSPWYLPCLTVTVLLFCAQVFRLATRSDRMILNEGTLRQDRKIK